jgi:hypothetical protein
MMSADNIQYELADRVQGLAAGGIGAILILARRTGLIADIDRRFDRTDVLDLMDAINQTRVRVWKQ